MLITADVASYHRQELSNRLAAVKIRLKVEVVSLGDEVVLRMRGWLRARGDAIENIL